jgi:HSP20 family protein
MNAFAITTPRNWSGRHGSHAGIDFPATSDLSRFTGLDRLFDVLLDGLSVHPTSQPAIRKGALHPALDIRREESAYLVSLEIPGIAQSDLRVEVSENELTISGEKRPEHNEPAGEAASPDGVAFYSERVYGTFTRVLTLPGDVDAGAIAASYKNGVLTLSLPRREPEKPGVRSINIDRE